MLKTLKYIGGENMSIEECLKKISEIRKDDISGSEENVRQKVIIPFFACFGHIHQTDIEHTTNRGSVDVFLKGLPDNSSVIVEVKPIHKKIEANEISQLKGYVEDTNALLAIISNGDNFQIYSPYWRGKAFEKTLIFNFNRGDLQDDTLVKELDKILCRKNLKNGRAHKLLFERESLIDNRINIEYDCKNLEKQIVKLKLKFKEANCEEAINHLIKYKTAMGENITKEEAIAEFLKNKPELKEISKEIKQLKNRVKENYELLESEKIFGLNEVKETIEPIIQLLDSTENTHTYINIGDVIPNLEGITIPKVITAKVFGKKYLKFSIRDMKYFINECVTKEYSRNPEVRSRITEKCKTVKYTLIVLDGNNHEIIRDDSCYFGAEGRLRNIAKVNKENKFKDGDYIEFDTRDLKEKRILYFYSL